MSSSMKQRSLSNTCYPLNIVIDGILWLPNLVIYHPFSGARTETSRGLASLGGRSLLLKKKAAVTNGCGSKQRHTARQLAAQVANLATLASHLSGTKVMEAEIVFPWWTWFIKNQHHISSLCHRTSFLSPALNKNCRIFPRNHQRYRLIRGRQNVVLQPRRRRLAWTSGGMHGYMAAYLPLPLPILETPDFGVFAPVPERRHHHPSSTIWFSKTFSKTLIFTFTLMFIFKFMVMLVMVIMDIMDIMVIIVIMVIMVTIVTVVVITIIIIIIIIIIIFFFFFSFFFIIIHILLYILLILLLLLLIIIIIITTTVTVTPLPSPHAVILTIVTSQSHQHHPLIIVRIHINPLPESLASAWAALFASQPAQPALIVTKMLQNPSKNTTVGQVTLCFGLIPNFQENSTNPENDDPTGWGGTANRMTFKKNEDLVPPCSIFTSIPHSSECMTLTHWIPMAFG